MITIDWIHENSNSPGQSRYLRKPPGADIIGLGELRAYLCLVAMQQLNSIQNFKNCHNRNKSFEFLVIVSDLLLFLKCIKLCIVELVKKIKMRSLIRRTL